MKGLAWRSALDRPLSLAGSFVALALSVGLLGAMSLTVVSAVSGTRLQPRWFTRAAVVVAGDDTVSVSTGTGDNRETGTVRTPAARAVPAALAARLATAASTASGAAAVTDYAGYGQAAGAPGQAIHPWAAAGLHPYRWVAGGPPDGPGQLVLTAPARYAPGQPVTVQTAAGPRRFTVSGVLATPAPPAFYATGAVARQLAGNRISAVALSPRAGQDAAGLARRVRSDARGLPVQVLTGDRRALAEPGPGGDLVAVASALLGSAAGVAGFVSVIVLAGTFGYAVAARRRELGLLRTTGATPRQVRRLVLGEALITGAAGAAAGTALGPVIAGPFAALLAREGFAPAGLTVQVIFWPWPRPAHRAGRAAADRRHPGSGAPHAGRRGDADHRRRGAAGRPGHRGDRGGRPGRPDGLDPGRPAGAALGRGRRGGRGLPADRADRHPHPGRARAARAPGRRGRPGRLTSRSADNVRR